MSVDDNWGEVLRKSAVQVNPGDKSEYMLRFTEVGGGGGGGSSTCCNRPFANNHAYKILDKLTASLTYDKVINTYSDPIETIRYYLAGSLVKTIEITYDLDDQSFEINSQVLNYLLQENGDFLLQENGDRIIL